MNKSTKKGQKLRLARAAQSPTNKNIQISDRSGAYRELISARIKKSPFLLDSESSQSGFIRLLISRSDIILSQIANERNYTDKRDQ